MRERESLTPDIEWETVKLKDIATFINGMAFKPSDWSENGKPIIRIQNLTGNTSNNYYNGIVDKKYEISDGDIIFSWSATIDAFIYKGQDAILNQHLFKVIPNNINKEFLYYILKNNVDKLKELSHGVSMKHIKKGDIENYVVSIPKNEKDQKKIAKVLSDLDELSRLHSLKVDELSKMKEHLMDNKSGIIENERNKQENNEWITVKVGDCLEYEQPTKYIVESTDYDDNYAIPVLTANKSFILGYTNEEFGIYNKGDVIIFDDFTCDCKYVDFKFKVKSGAMKLLTPKDGIDLKFMYYMLKTLNVDTTAHKRYYIQDVAEREIEIPKSITEQKRIAKVLTEYDNMVASQEQLISIIQRERVYASSFSDNHQSTKWRTVKIKDIIKISSGSFVKKDLQVDDGEYPVYNGGISNTGYYTAFNVQGPKVILSSRGASAGYVNLVKTDFWAGNSCYVMNILNDEEVDIEYLYYIMKCNESKLSEQKVQGAIPAVNMSQVYELEIDLPDIKEQKRIASILKDYDKMLNSQEKLIELIQRESLCVKLLRQSSKD